MSSRLARARDWLIAPPDERPAERDDTAPERPRRWLEPVPPSRGRGAPPRRRDVKPQSRREAGAARAPAPPAHESPGWAPSIDRDAASRGERFVATGAPARVAVLGHVDDVPAMAAAVALAMRRRRRTSAALVLLWPWPGAEAAAESYVPFVAPPAPALPGARLLAGRLVRRGVEARAHGRLVWVPLAVGPGDAAVLARRADAAAGDVPSILAVMAPRDATVDALVSGCELAIVVSEPESALAELALDDLGALGPRARAVAPIPAGPARLAALAGLRAPRPEQQEAVA